MEYYGKCPACGSYDHDTIETYDKPTSRGAEIRYICHCNECGCRFDVNDDGE
jgi:transcriptional regulator NrdR family protein